MNQDETQVLWQLEQQFWLGSADFYAATLAANALMVLPHPAGVLDRDATIESIRSGARWHNVSFEQQRIIRSGETAVLIYLAHATRHTSDTAYVAQCSSTYAIEQGRWLLVAHHQSPANQ